MSKLIKVGITQGDHNGIGLEVVMKALGAEGMTDLLIPILFADYRLVDHTLRMFNIENVAVRRIQKPAEARQGQINVIDLKLNDITIERGTPTPVSGQGAVMSLQAATDAILAGDIDVMVTAPISKEAVQSDSFRFAGHTEYLNDRAGSEHKAQMILFDDNLRVALVTSHLPISQLSQAITLEKVSQSIREFSDSLTRDFSITRPKIAVLSLNPHVGDGGVLGTEESNVISPAIEDCINEGILAFGPYAADGFFGSGAYKNFDGILAMYHDQGLAPFKALSSTRGVNFTAGLPFVRTSPDHGTAYDIAWKGEADPQSMREALYKAIDIFRNRKIHEEISANPLKVHVAENKQDRNKHTVDKQNSASEENGADDTIKEEGV